VAGLVVCTLALLVAGAWRMRERWAPKGKGAPDQPEQVENSPPGQDPKGPGDVGAGPRIPADLPVKPPMDIPEKLRNDFRLEVTMLGGRDGKMVPLVPRQSKEGQEVFLLGDGQDVEFRIKVAQKAYVRVWTIETGGTILQLFPNFKEFDYLFQAGGERTVPKVGVRTTKSEGMDLVWVVASDNPWDQLQGDRHGFFLLFEKEHHREAWKQTLRGMELKKDIRFSEKVLKYFVPPRP
jgi:hypothetical protein